MNVPAHAKPRSISLSRHSPSVARRFSGFTLIELLVAMAIFAVILTAIYAAWLAIMRGSEAGMKAAAAVQRERIAIHTIEQALTTARSFQLDVQHYGFIAENGSDPTLSFVARLPKSFPRGGRFGDFDVRRVEFAVKSGTDSQRELVLRQCPILMEFDQDEREHPLVLARHVKDFKFDMWDERAKDWTDTWTQTNLLPKMIRVTLELETPTHDYRTVKEEFVRIIALPSVAVAANWQRPGAGGPGGPMPGNPNIPIPNNPNLPIPGNPIAPPPVIRR